MPSISLKIVQDGGAVTRKVKFDSRNTVKEAHKIVKDKVIVPDKKKEYALFLRSADDDITGMWLDNERTLDYYKLRDGDSLDYLCTVRNLRVRMLDDTLKTMQVDEVKTVGELMFDICGRIGIVNHEEYGLCREEVEEEGEESKENKEQSTGTLTLTRKRQNKDRDVALEQLSKKLKTDDNVEWLDQHRTLREQGVDINETLLLKRRLFFSDRNVDSRDPLQLNLLYVQTRDAILSKRHPVTEDQATEFAGIQCQIKFGDFQEAKHKPGFLENLEEYLPPQYLNEWNIEKKILKAYAKHQGVSELDAKYLYIKTARSLPTYGVTFFLVKEKQKNKEKLVPRLLGINAEAILRLDENTKEILQQWPLTHVKTYHVGKSNTFTLNFGDYSDKEYSVKTQDAYRIRNILEGYIDIIRRRMLAKPSGGGGDSMAICHDNVQAGKSHLIEHVSNNPSKLVTETFVGPNRVLPFDQGSQAQQGTQIMTAQQIIITDHLQNRQQALKGEVPMRGDMSMDCAKKLNGLNSSSVKIVTLLTDPTEANIKEAQKIVESMQQDFPDVEKGIKDTAEKQTVDEARKMLLDELADLQDYLNKLTKATRPGQFNRDDAKEAAENIADLTTQIYFSMDPNTRRRSGFLRRSRKSFKAGERQEQKARRESLASASKTAMSAVNNAGNILQQEYKGPKIDEHHRKRLEKALEEKMGKLNAAIALYLTAHSDPENIDYAAAINSMNDINELMPELARDGQALASTKDAAARKELLDDMKTLFDATNKICAFTSSEDHEKIQEASNKYADVAGKLIFTFARGTNADKENEIIELARQAGDKTSVLLVKANELTCQLPNEPAAQHVDEAGVKTVGAARDLLACAQLTAPAIHEPHCQSALRAAAAGVSGAVQRLEGSCRPLLDHPHTSHIKDPLHHAANDVYKALTRLEDAFGHLSGSDGAEDPSVPLRERQRLKFIASMDKVQKKPLQVEDVWDKSATTSPTQEQKAEAQRRLEQQTAQLNAAVSALTAATADRKNPDYATAELAINTISELMPQIIKDTEVVSSDKDQATRAAMLKQVQALYEAARDMCYGTGYQHGQGEDAAKFSAASGKLVFLISPGADKGKEKKVMQLSASICDKSADILTQAHRMKEHLGPEEAQLLDEKMARFADMAKALNAVTQLSASSISEPRCQSTLLTSAERLREAGDQLTITCKTCVPDDLQVTQLMSTKQQLDDGLNKLVFTCGMPDGKPDMIEELKQKQRLKFVRSLSSANRHLQSADELLNKPIESISMTPEDKAALEHKLSQELAALNAGVANLLAATADRKNPNYAAANRAIETISDWMPLVVQDGATLCGTKDKSAQAQVVQHIRDLCEATRAVCDLSAQPEGLLQGDAVANYTAASNKLLPLVGNNVDNAQKDKIMNLTTLACGKTGELLAKVSSSLYNEDPEYAHAVDSKGANTADSAKTLLTIAQMTSPTISEPTSSAALISAVEDLDKSVIDLTSTCKRPVQEQVKDTVKQLDDCLKQLLHSCKEVPPRKVEAPPGVKKPAVGQKPAQQKKPAVPTRTAPLKPDDSSAAARADREQQRLKMISGVSVAKERLDAAEKLLNEPVVCQLMSEADGVSVERGLAQRVAQLNAAVAALGVANADRENPDYVAAEKALASISELMPHIVQDSRNLCATKEGPEQEAMIKHVQALCEATREVCDNALQPQGSSDAAAKFSAASGNFFFQVSPQASNDVHEKQVIELTAAACGKASELLSQVHSLGEQVSEPAAVLDTQGACTADAAQTLLSVAQVTAPTISDPTCATTLIYAADKLRSNADKLTAACQQQAPHSQQSLNKAKHELELSLDKLKQACHTAQRGSMVSLSPEQEKERDLFVNSIAGVKQNVHNSEKQLMEPVLCQLMSEEDGVKLQHQLSRQLAQLNAAVAALAAATCDGKNPDYPAAERAVTTINEMMPQIIQDSRKLCGSTADQAQQAVILQNLKTLCDATKDICNSNGQPKKLHQASAKLADASGKLVFIVSPGQKTQQKRSVDDTQDVVLSPQQEKERVKFVNNISNVKPNLDNAEKQLVQPVLCQLMSEEDGVKLQHQLSRQLAQLNAAVDSLRAATSDSKNPDYPAAEKAVNTINDMIPKIVQDSRKLCGSTADQAQQEAILQNLKTLCDATKDICNSNGQPKKLHQASAKLADASGKLMFIVSPGQKTQKRSVDTPDVALSPQQEKERDKFVNNISNVKPNLDNAEKQLMQPVLCQLMSEEDGVKLQHQLSRQLAQLNVAVDSLRGATSDSKNPDYPAAEKAVNTINDMIPKIVQDSRKLCGSTADQAQQAVILQNLKTLCDATKDICNSNGQPKKLQQASAKLADATGKLVFIVSPGHKTRKRSKDDTQDVVLSPQQEKQRVMFVNNISNVKPNLDNAEKQLVQPVLCQLMSEEDGVKLQHQLSRQLAQLNAAVDSLRDATSDSKNPDYPAAEEAVNTINDMIPKIVQDSRKLCGSTADQAQQAVILQNLKILCDATKDICNSNGQPKKLQQASAKLADASGKLLFIVSPGNKTQKRSVDDTQDVVLSPQQEKERVKFVNNISNVKPNLDNAEKQLVQPVLCQLISEEAGVKLQHQLSRQLAQLNAAVDSLRAATSDSKNPDYPAAEEAVNTINDMIPKVVQDSRKLCGSTADQAQQAVILQNLKTLCDATKDICNSDGQPKKLHQASAKLADASGKLLFIVSPGHKTQKRSVDDTQDVVLSPQQEKERVKFVNNISNVKPNLDNVGKQLVQPVLCQLMSEEDGVKLQHQLSRQLAQLNAAVDSLRDATSDSRNPDYPAAEKAVNNINDMIPKIVQDSRKLCGSTADQAQQAVILQNLKTLCDATKDICNSNGQPKKLHQASAKLVDASGKLVFIVSPGQKTQQKRSVDATQGPKPPAVSKKPAVPSRDGKPGVPTQESKPHTIAHVVPNTRKSAEITHDFLERLRCEESQEQRARVVSVSSKPVCTDDEKCAQKRYAAIIDDADKEISRAREELQLLYGADTIHVSGCGLSPLELADKEQHMEDTLAKAGVEVAALVGANYADKLDYKAAAEPTSELIHSLKSIVDDGTLIVGALPEETRKPFIADLMGLCDAAQNICHAANSEKEKLNDAAIRFGDQSTKLLRVVSSDVNPTLEKELISRAKAIGDSASRLALEAGKVASNSNSEQNNLVKVQDICTAGAKCVDSAGKLVYTAKLVAPTIHHNTCQDSIVSSADNLSAALKSFSNTWLPLSSTQQPTVHKLTEEANNLEKLVEKLRNDVKLGKMYGKKKSVMVNVDTPLRQMTLQVIENANKMSEHGQLSPELKKQYSEYSGRLAEALRLLDLANVRCQRAPRDKVKRNQMEMAIQDLQMTLLQSRPSRSGQVPNNIVDFRDFLQDLVKESKELQDTATKHQGPVGKRATEDIKLLCSKISEDAHKLLQPTDQGGDVIVMEDVDDILDFDHFGEECDAIIKEINSTISKIQDQKAKQALRAKALPLCESCNLLRFAVNSHISATKSAAYDEALQHIDNLQTNVVKPLLSDVINNKKERKVQVTPLGSRACCQRVLDDVVVEAQRAAAGEPQQLVKSVAKYAVTVVNSVTTEPMLAKEERLTTHLSYVLNEVARVTNSSNVDCITWNRPLVKMQCQHTEVREDFNMEAFETILNEQRSDVQVLNKDDIELLIRCEKLPVEGTPMQLEDRVQELSSKLTSLSGNIVQNLNNSEFLTRNAHNAAQTASHLANTARALAKHKKPAQSSKIEEGAREMCLATYSLLKTSELVCQEPNHHDSRRKMLDALRRLNDCINKLVRAVNPSEKVPPECGEAMRSLQLQRAMLHSSPQPCGALPYEHTVDTLHGQKDVLQKLNSDVKMSRAEFMKNLLFITSAVNNSAECAAQATYLLSVSDKDESIGKEGIPDVSKLRNIISTVQDTCVNILVTRDVEQIAEEVKELDTKVQELITSLEEEMKKVKKPYLKDAVMANCNELRCTIETLNYDVQHGKHKEKVLSSVYIMLDDMNYLDSLLEHSDLVPTAGPVSKETKADCDDIAQKSLALLTNTEELLKQVKNTSSSDRDDTMTWVMFNKRKDVLDAFDALLNSIKSSGQKKKLIESTDDSEEEQKQSYVQKQFELASKWLSKPTCKPQVKSNGQQAVTNLIDVANKLLEDLKDSEKEDMRNLIVETEQLLKECSKKYDHEQYSVLMERCRELKKCIERGVVTRVVEEFMQAEEPLQDLEILADAEKDEKSRKFLLERKIAELLAHLGRVTKTARLIAHTDTDDKNTQKLNSSTQQAELLAPMLVKAAQERIARPDDKEVIEKYKSLLAKYAESLSKIRDLCDQSVDPMDFVQTAGETMIRMREECSRHNEPQQCSQTSAAISRLASRVIHAGLASRAGRTDPELRAALARANQHLTAATPHSTTRASNMPDWKDTTAKILQTTEEVESLLGGETIFKKQPEPNQPIYKGALDLHVAIRDWSSRDNEIVAVAKRMAVLMAKLSNFMNIDKQRDVLTTSKSIVEESHEVARLAKKLAHECTDHRIKTNLLQACERIPTISGQLKMLTTVKGFSLGRHGTQEDKEAMDMLVGNAQSLMLSIQDVVKGAASASVKISAQRGLRMKWVRKKSYN